MEKIKIWHFPHYFSPKPHILGLFLRPVLVLPHNLHQDIKSSILPSDFWKKYLYDCAADSIDLWYSDYFTSFCNDVSSRSPRTYVHISGRLTRASLTVEILKILESRRLYSKFATGFCMHLLSVRDECSKHKHCIYTHQNTLAVQ